jgi:TP901 family phage tail tape measure protein
MAFIVGEIAAPVTADSSQFNAAMSQVRATGEKTVQGLGAQLQNLSKHMAKVGKDLTKYVTLPLAGIGFAATKTGMGFESEMSKVIGLVGIAKEQVNAWSDDLVRMAPELGKAPKELAEGLFFVTSAGLRGTEAMDALEKSAKAAAAGLGETKTIADAVTSAMNAYGAENMSAGRATDVLVAAVREGKLEASELAPVLGGLLPTASALKIGFDQVAGALAVMSRTGTNAAEGATSVSAIMTAMLKPTDGARKALEAVGLSMADLRKMAAQEPDGLVQAMRTLDDAFGDNEEALAEVIPNVRAFRGIMNVLAQDSKIVDSVMSGVVNSTGSLDHAFKTVTETAAFKWNQVLMESQGALMALWKVLRDALVPILEDVKGKIQGVTEWFKALEPQQKESIVKWAGIAMAIGPLLIVGSKLILVIKGIATALTFLAANPVVLAIAGITAAIGGLVYISTTASKKVREATDEKIAAYKQLAEEGMKALDSLYQKEISLLQGKIDQENSLHHQSLANIEEKVQKEIEAEERKTELILTDLEEQQSQLEEGHKDNLARIRNEYGVVEETIKSKVDLENEAFDTRVKQLQEEHDKEIGTLEMRKQAIIEAYDVELSVAQETHDQIIVMLEEQLNKQKERIDRESSLVVGEMEDRIKLLEGATTEEVAIEKQKRLERRAIELEAMIAAETDKAEKEKLTQEREDIIQQIVQTAADQELEIRKWEIREEILEEMIKAAELKKQAEETTNAKIEEANRELEEKALILTQEKDAKLEAIQEEERAVKESLKNQIKEAELARDEQIRIIQEERIAKETAENEKYEAMKTSLAEQIKEAENNLVEQKRIIEEGMTAAILAETTRHNQVISDLDAEIAKITAWKDSMAAAITKKKEADIAKAEEEAKRLKNTIAGSVIEGAGKATLWPGGPSIGGIIEGAGKAVESIGKMHVQPFKEVGNMVGGLVKNIFGSEDVPHYASGTGFHPGGLALVGEQGPELINLSKGAEVIPFSENADPYSSFGSNLGTQDVHVHFHEAVYGLLDFEQRIKRIVMDTGRSGGFRGVFPSG